VPHYLYDLHSYARGFIDKLCDANIMMQCIATALRQLEPITHFDQPSTAGSRACGGSVADSCMYASVLAAIQQHRNSQL
jgi:hypothetical protein